MTDLSVVEGRSYGPFPVAVSPSRVAAFVAATGDDPDRWAEHAPPGYAASILFEAAPAFFADEAVHPFLTVLIHTEQRFEWPRPLPVGSELDVTGTIRSVRERAGLNLVALTVEAVGSEGVTVVSKSTFMMAANADIPDGADEPEPGVRVKARSDQASTAPLPGVGEPLPTLHKSASRLDLVKYAAASGDFNPIHWDHDAARAAGIDGVIAHGLLMGAWLGQSAAQVSDVDHAPLGDIRLRFRRPLKPAAPASIDGTVTEADTEAAKLKLALSSNDAELVTATATIRRAT